MLLNIFQKQHAISSGVKAYSAMTLVGDSGYVPEDIDRLWNEFTFLQTSQKPKVRATAAHDMGLAHLHPC